MGMIRPGMVCPAIAVALSLAALSAQAGKFTVASWNIGHFSLGVSATSTIPTADASKWIAEYHRLLDPLDASLIGVCEYSPFLDREKTVSVRKALFGDYPIAFEGPTDTGGHVDSLFLRNCTAEKSVVTYFSQRFQNTSFHRTEVEVAGVRTVFIMTHLEPNWPEDHRSMRQAQMRQLLDAVADQPYVIINADWNVCDQDELKPFVDAGFSLANDGSLKTWHTSDPKFALDNIVVKGFVISDARAHPVGSLSDHLLVSCSLEPIPMDIVRYDLTDRYEAYLPAHETVVWKNRRLREFEEIEGYIDGAWIMGRTLAKGLITARDDMSMTVQFQALSGQCKAVRAHFRQQGADVVGYADKAGYGNAEQYGSPLPESAFVHPVSESASTGSYGVYDLEAFGDIVRRVDTLQSPKDGIIVTRGTLGVKTATSAELRVRISGRGRIRIIEEH